MADIGVTSAPLCQNALMTVVPAQGTCALRPSGFLILRRKPDDLKMTMSIPKGGTGLKRSVRATYCGYRGQRLENEEEKLRYGMYRNQSTNFLNCFGFLQHSTML